MSVKKLYVAGRRFKVVKEGARFEGLLLYGEQSMSGWSRRIEPGEILTCLGWQEMDVFGTHIAGVMWTGPKVPDNAMVMQVWPFESLFRPYPMRGVLEPYVEPLELDEEDLQVATPAQPAPPEPPPAAIEPEPAPEVDEEIVDLTGSYKPAPAALKDEEEDEIVDLTNW